MLSEVPALAPLEGWRGGWVSLRPEWVDGLGHRSSMSTRPCPGTGDGIFGGLQVQCTHAKSGSLACFTFLEGCFWSMPHQTSDVQVQKFFCRAVVNAADQAMGRMKSLMPTSRRTQG